MTGSAPNRALSAGLGPPGKSGRWGRGLLGLLLVAFVVLGLFLAVTSVRILNAARQQELHSADAIVVFGAAEYFGHPSPVYRARLDHAYDLYQRGLAPVVITTGGAGEDPKFSEGGVGRDYLMHRGIVDRNLIAETQGADTAQSAERVAVILRTNGMRSCLAVSDAYHVFRIRELLQHEGIQVLLAPRLGSRPPTFWKRTVAVLREAASYLVWKVSIL